MKKNRLLLILVLIIVFGRLFLPGPRAAGDFPFSSSETVREGFNIPQVWSSRGNGMGRYVLSTLWAWPVDFLYGMGAFLGLDFSVLERIIGIFPVLVFGIFGISRLLRRLGVSGIGKMASILVYVANSYLILLIDGGQLSVAMAYAFLPLTFLTFEDSLEGNLRKKILAGLAVSILGFFDLRFVFVFLLILLLKFVYELLFLHSREWPHFLLSWFRSGLVILLVMVGLHSFWIFSSFLAKPPQLPAGYLRKEQTQFLNFANIGHATLLLQPHWFKNVFGKVTHLKADFFLIPLLVFLAPILRKRDKTLGFWLFVLLVGIFLVKGSNPPLSEIYAWLFTNIAGFSFFRDSTKFFVLIALSYSVLVGIAVNELNKKIAWLARFLPLGIFLYFVIIMRPVWLGKMTGMFSLPVYQKEFSFLENVLKSDENWGRVLWIPTRFPMGYSSLQHTALSATDLTEIRPFITGNVGTYEIFNFIRESKFVSQLFDVAGISYVVYPYPDERREDLNEDEREYYQIFLNQLVSLDWLSVIKNESKVPILKTLKHQNHIFVAPKFWWVVGSDRIYSDLVSIKDFDLSKNAIIFLEENTDLFGKFIKYPNSKVILYDKNTIDLAVSSLDSEDLIFPAKNLTLSPNDSGWWKREASDFLSWRFFLQEKYGVDNLDFDLSGGWAVGEGNLSLKIKNAKLKKGTLLLARVMESSKGGVIRFYQDSKLIGEVNTLLTAPKKIEIKLTGYQDVPDKYFIYDEANIRWFEIGKLESSGEITIEVSGGINVLNALVGIEEQRWELLKRNVQDLVTNAKALFWSDLSDNEKISLFTIKEIPEVEYLRKNPTEYWVKVKGLKEPSFLILSEQYDKFWQMNEVSSLPAYSFLNAFMVEKDGFYKIYYSPQKYVLPGLVISGFSLILASAILVKLHNKKRV